MTMTEQPRAVFLSYASQDAEAAQRICESLRSGGIEVWFDQSELRGGDVWDAAIRRQIKTCRLFIPLISSNTHNRQEGYFRLEWKLAVDRSHLMSSAKAFLLPIAIDDTTDNDEHVPDAFRAVQWTRLPAGETPPSFVARVGKLLSSEENLAASSVAAGSPASRVAVRHRPRLAVFAVGSLAVIAGGYFVLHRAEVSRHANDAPVAGSTEVPGKSAPSAIPELSIAVLPFVNMSSDKEQDYFSDGLTEQMIDLLGQIAELRVPARTSSFYFKGRNEPIGSIAKLLRVAHLLEGSVRKSGKRLRITAQLIRAENGYQIWSQTYDRDDSDIFAVQDDIAKAVVGALQVKLTTAVPVSGARGTSNPEAYNQYLLGRQLYRREGIEGWHQAVEAYQKAIALDPDYAAAYAQLALTYAWIGDFTGDSGDTAKAVREVEKAITLAPQDALGYSVRSFIRSSWLWDWSGAQADIEKALILDPSSSQVEHQHARILHSLGNREQEVVAAQRRATELDPLSSQAWENLGAWSLDAGDYATAQIALSRSLQLEPTSMLANDHQGVLHLLQGRPQEALLAFKQVNQEDYRLQGIAMAEHTLGHAKQAQQALDELIAKHAQEAAYQVAQTFAWLGETDHAFHWLDRSYEQQDGGLSFVKSDPLLKPLRADPRFNALLRRLKLPE